MGVVELERHVGYMNSCNQSADDIHVRLQTAYTLMWYTIKILIPLVAFNMGCVQTTKLKTVDYLVDGCVVY